MKIVYVITGLSMGGAEKQVCLLADKMVERGHEVTLVSLGTNAKVLPEHKDVKVMQMSMTKNPFSLVKTFLALSKIIEVRAPDVVHSHLFHANIICRLIRCLTKMNVLISSSHSRYEGGKVRMFLYKITSHLCDLITNVSIDAVNENIHKKIAPLNKIIAVSNGIDTDKFKFIPTAKKKLLSELSLSEEHMLILAVGRFTEAKDYPNLLQSFKILISEKGKVNLRLLIAGDGELFDKISLLRHQLDLVPYVIFLGVRDDIPQLMSAADIYVMSSAWEGMPLVIGEAMSCNCLIVTTRCGGVAEILGDCGTIVPTNSPAHLADGILYALELDDAEINEFTSKARTRIEDKFSINAVVDNWLNIYKKHYAK
ncbi:glycosyltransferase [Enterobacter intestinihominis]|uniref:glycosyltransferase n=1 Tax=Enterobacter hormaechei TaxID=158836 RepID=UPI003860726D